MRVPGHFAFAGGAANSASGDPIVAAVSEGSMWRKATVSEEPRKRVAIIGAGASGMAAAWSLARFPDKFDVTVIEASEDCGGVACTLDHQGTKINYGVQGGSPAAHSNTVELMKTFGFDVGPTKLDVSFGLGEYNWKNYESKPLQQRLVKETRRFGDVLKWVSRLECVTIFISIDFLLKSLNFSEDFRHRMVYPLVALFFGTGNQTPFVSSAVVARVFLDKSLAIFDYDPEHLLQQTPQNLAFDNLQAFYAAVREAITGEHCRFRMRTRATRLVRLGDKSLVTLVILACPANIARELLAEGASFWERRVLSSVRYFHDLTVTHTDEAYMRKHYEVDGRAIYFIKSDPEHPELLEMGFDLTAYQPTLQAWREGGRQRVYQTIYLDRDRSERWPIREIQPECIIDKAWWSAFSHTYQHFRQVVPWVWTLQGHRHTWYAGSWTLFNTHDIAIASGLAAAHRLGAPYPFGHNALAAATFDTVLAQGHLRVRGESLGFGAPSPRDIKVKSH